MATQATELNSPAPVEAINVTVNEVLEEEAPSRHSDFHTEIEADEAARPQQRLISRIQKYALVRGTRAAAQTVPGTLWATGVVSLVYEPLRNSFCLRYLMDTSDMVVIGLLDQCDRGVDGIFGNGAAAEAPAAPVAEGENTVPAAEGEAPGTTEPAADVHSSFDAHNSEGSFVSRLGQNARDLFHYIVYDNQDGRFFSGPADLVFGGINRGLESFVSTHWPQTRFPDNHHGEFAKLMTMVRTILRRQYTVESEHSVPVAAH